MTELNKPLTLQLAEKIRTIRDQYNAAYQLFNQEKHTVPVGVEEKLRSCLPLLEDGISLAAKIKNAGILQLLIQLRQKTDKVFSGEKSIAQFFWDETVGIWLRELMKIADKLEIAGRIEQQAGQALVKQHNEYAPKILEQVRQTVQENLTDTKQNSGKEKELSKEVQVLAIFADNPKLSDTEIAKKAGISRTSLYRMKKFKQVKEVLQSSKADLPKGSKSKDGDIEAWNE
jgi:DNA-binding phage protein